MKSVVLALAILCGLVHAALAQADVPSIVSRGVETYKKSDGKAALSAWLKGSPVENDTATNIRVVGLLSQVEAAYGKVIGYEPLRVVAITPSWRHAYLLIKFEKGPLYASFDCYKAAEDWIVTQCDFNTQASEVLPPNLLDGSRN